MVAGRARKAVWLARPTRWARLDRGQARIVLTLAALLLGACLIALRGAALAANGGHGGTADIALYGAIVDSLRHGGAYYAVVADALRQGGYPLHPFMTFRLPTLAVVEAAEPPPVVAAVLLLLAISTVAAWYARLRDEVRPGVPRLVMLLLVIVAVMPFAHPDLVLFHEVWAGLLIALALALYRPERWLETVTITLIAMLIRETALLFALVMAAMALIERSRRELIGWMVAIAVFGTAIVFHAIAADAVAGTADPSSPGWTGLLGFGFFIRAVAATTPLALLPLVIAALLLGIAFIGWVSWATPAGARGAATIVAYAALLGIAARADTFYWAAMIGPLLPIGLVFAPDGVMQLIHRALDRRRITVTRVSR